MEHDPEYVFHNIEDIIMFVEWIRDNFDSPDEYSSWFEFSIDDVAPPEVFCTRSVKETSFLFSCPQCKAKFSTAAGLDIHKSVLHKKLDKESSSDKEFWKIINEEYKEEDDDEGTKGNNSKSISDSD